VIASLHVGIQRSWRREEEQCAEGDSNEEAYHNAKGMVDWPTKRKLGDFDLRYAVDRE